MTRRALEEYRALRATIRQRGTSRIWAFATGLVAWGALTIATAALAALPIATLLPLLVLAGFFETVFALHVGIERIGRYIQVFYEEDRASGAESATRDTAFEAGESGPATPSQDTNDQLRAPGSSPPAPGNRRPAPVPHWEHAAMAFGRPAHAVRVDPLFASYFIAASILNFVPAALAQPVALEVAVVGTAHVLFIVRVVVARSAARRQRDVDLARFRELKEHADRRT